MAPTPPPLSGGYLPELTWAQVDRQLTTLCARSARRRVSEGLLQIQRAAQTWPEEQILREVINLALETIVPPRAS